MECKYWVLGVRWGLDWAETHILRPGYVAVELGWAEEQFSWPGCMWDMKWMDVRCQHHDLVATWIEEFRDMDGCETVHGGGGGGGGGHGCRWGRTWMEVPVTHMTHIMIPGWVSDWTWMNTRCSFRDPHEGETWPGWRWDVHITPGLYNLDPPPSRWQITSIKVPK